MSARRSFSKEAVLKGNKRKQRRTVVHLSDYWLRKSLHIRVLPQTYKEAKKFAIDEEVHIQGILEYFLCKLLDKDEQALAMLREYKEMLKRGGQSISTSDIDDILKVIEANSPLNRNDNNDDYNEDS